MSRHQKFVADHRFWGFPRFRFLPGFRSLTGCLTPSAAAFKQAVSEKSDNDNDLAGRPWPAPRRPPRITSCDSFGGQNRYEPSPNILKYSRQFLVFFDTISGVRH